MDFARCIQPCTHNVMVSINRLLDENREIRMPETGEVILAALGFEILSTPSPPRLYGGGKELSQALKGS
jgi:midasin (ATPase involved in ribosome maturation)